MYSSFTLIFFTYLFHSLYDGCSPFSIINIIFDKFYDQEMKENNFKRLKLTLLLLELFLYIAVAAALVFIFTI